MTTALNAAQIWAECLTDSALSAHLRKLTENPRFFGKSQREALLTEAADRFEGIRKCPGCGVKTNLRAISRFDSRTYICSSCASNEGIATLNERGKIVSPGKVSWS